MCLSPFSCTGCGLQLPVAGRRGRRLACLRGSFSIAHCPRRQQAAGGGPLPAAEGSGRRPAAAAGGGGRSSNLYCRLAASPVVTVKEAPLSPIIRVSTCSRCKAAVGALLPLPLLLAAGGSCCRWPAAAAIGGQRPPPRDRQRSAAVTCLAQSGPWP